MSNQIRLNNINSQKQQQKLYYENEEQDEKDDYNYQHENYEKLQHRHDIVKLRWKDAVKKVQKEYMHVSSYHIQYFYLLYIGNRVVVFLKIHNIFYYYYYYAHFYIYCN